MCELYRLADCLITAEICILVMRRKHVDLPVSSVLISKNSCQIIYVYKE